MRLVLVHGRDQQGKSTEFLQKVWKEALDVGLSEAGLQSIDNHEMMLPFYGDALAEYVGNVRSAEASRVTAKGAQTAESHIKAFQAELLQEILRNEDESSPTPGSPIQKGVQNTNVAHILAKFADGSPWGKEFLSLLTEDVAVYLNSTTTERAINAIVKDAIPNNEPCVVVGHSLGSVVAYRVLRELGSSANVVRFITVGSPLGLITIRNMLRPLSVPGGVRSWLNVYDTRDIVSLYPLDKTTWDVSPEIANIALDKNHMGNRHGISGYLDYVEVASAVFNSLNGLAPHFVP
jgi:hypothetical protein